MQLIHRDPPYRVSGPPKNRPAHICDNTLSNIRQGLRVPFTVP
jgi:hypothetical protein